MRRACLFVLVLALGASCKRSEGEAAAASESAANGPLAVYRASLEALAPLETRALAAVTANTGPGYTDDATLVRALRETAIPAYREYLDGLRALSPAGDDVKEFHRRLVALAERQLSLLERMADAVEGGHGTQVLYVNRDHQALRAEIAELLDDYRELAEKRTAVTEPRRR